MCLRRGSFFLVPRATVCFAALEVRGVRDLAAVADFDDTLALVAVADFLTANFDLAIGLAVVVGSFEELMPFEAAEDFIVLGSLALFPLSAFWVLPGFVDAREIVFKGEPGFVGLTDTVAFIAAVAFAIAGLTGDDVLRCGDGAFVDTFGIIPSPLTDRKAVALTRLSKT